MKNKIIIFGRSLFVKKINFEKIDYKNYDICCINTINPKLKKIDYVVSVDYYINFPENRNFEWISPQTGWLFIDTQDNYVIKDKCLSWRFFSSSIAVSFAIFKGYKEIYLAGVDLISGKPIKHYDDKCVGKEPLKEYMCESEKEFIKQICNKNGIKIYTLNKNNTWVEYKDIGITKMSVKKITDMKEDESQKYIVSWCLQNNLIAVAVPNGMNLNGAVGIMRKYGVGTTELKAQNAKQIALLKKEGLHVGFPDLMIFGIKDGVGKVLFMENKVKSNKTSLYQDACGEWLGKLGFDVKISTSSQNAISQIKEYFDSTTQEINQEYLDKRQEISTKIKEKKICAQK